MASKANLNIALAILYDLTNNPSNRGGATAAIAEANIKRDGFDKNDVNEIAANSTLDQIGSPIEKAQFNFGNNPELIKDISNWAGFDVTPVIYKGSEQDITEMLSEYLEANNVEIPKISAFGEGGQFESDLDIVNVKIGNKTYKLLYLLSEEQKETGLKNVQDMESDEGALFDYSDNPQEHLSFWMKDTTIGLKVLFINKDGVVISVHTGKPLSEDLMTEESEPVYWVIEINDSEDVTQGTYTNLALRKESDAEVEEEESDEDEHPEIKVKNLYIYGSDGQVQATLQGGERIFSRKATKTIIRKAKRAYLSHLDKDYKSLGRYVFNEIKAQDNRPAEYVDSPS